jgi:uncharacterized protein
LTPPSPIGRRIGLLALTLAVAIVGGGIAALAGLPAAWLSGAMAAVGIAALFGLEASIPPRLRDAVFLVLGVSMGAGVTPSLLGQLAAWPLTLLGLAVTTSLVTVSSFVFLRRFAGWDAPTAYFASIPGALTMTLAVAETSPADMRRVSLAQTIRLFMLVAVLPMMVATFDPEATARTLPAIDDGYEAALLMAAGVTGAVVGVLCRVPAGLLLGAFAGSGLMHGFGVVEGQIPDAIQLPAFIVLGAMIGLRFAGTGWRVLAATLVSGLGSFAVATIAATAVAVLVAAMSGMPVGQVLLAFAPGGLEVMIILAFVLAADPAFVAAHHVARFLGLTVAVPLLAPLVYGQRSSYATKVGPDH